jgi:hypothetical protein
MWAGNVARVGQATNAERNLLVNVRWEDDSKMDF